MSQMRVTKRVVQRKNACNFDSIELKSLLAPLLSPILCQIKVLNETVNTLVSVIEHKDTSEYNKKNVMSDFTIASITADVSMLASDTHRLSKCCETLKDQISDNQKNLNRLHEKMTNIEKLVGALVKRKAKKRTMIDPKMQELLQHFENYLVQNTSKPCSGQSGGFESDSMGFIETKVGMESGRMQILTLNNEEDYPHGSWLGDSAQRKFRVRCCLREEDLVYINTKCTTPVKMALTLLDYLFPKEVLAVSNLSGKGKLGKKRLDPLIIYGIKCHLMHYFNISEKEWEKIKQNIDSKCRAAWKKRRMTSEYCISFDEVYPEDSRSKDSLVEIPSFTNSHEEIERPKTRVIRTVKGDVEVVHADQVLRLQDLHNIHVLDGDHILPIINSDGEDAENGISLSKFAEHNDLAIIAENADLTSTDTVSFVMEPMLEVLTENEPLISDSGGMIEER